MFSGVLKSGSPRAKSRTSTPSAFRPPGLRRPSPGSPKGAIKLERSASTQDHRTSSTSFSARSDPRVRPRSPIPWKFPGDPSVTIEQARHDPAIELSQNPAIGICRRNRQSLSPSLSDNQEQSPSKVRILITYFIHSCLILVILGGTMKKDDVPMVRGQTSARTVDGSRRSSVGLVVTSRTTPSRGNPDSERWGIVCVASW